MPSRVSKYADEGSKSQQPATVFNFIQGIAEMSQTNNTASKNHSILQCCNNPTKPHMSMCALTKPPIED